MNTNIQIPSFNGEYSFLSNMYECATKVKGIVFPSAEHAYVYHKMLYSSTPEVASLEFLLSLAPKQTKSKISRKLTMSPHWHEIKGDIMREIVFAKFTQNRDLAELLTNTGTDPIEEGNTWGDTYFGKTKEPNGEYVGQNVLGELLMEVRDKIRENPDKVWGI